MPVLELRDAGFARAGSTLLAPVFLSVEYGSRAQWACESALGAAIVARLAAGVIKCSTGQVFVADFDPKIQPVQVKRLVGFLPSERPANPLPADDYFAYRAALWGLERRGALARGRALLARLDALPGSEAALLAGIFLHDPALIVLENPHDTLRAAAESLAQTAAVFVTYDRHA